MTWLDKLSGFQRSLHGLEWALWKRLPAVLRWRTVLPLAAAALVWWWAPKQTSPAAADADRLLLTYKLLGSVVSHRSLPMLRLRHLS